MLLDPAPFRQTFKEFPTPLIGDVLFQELRDMSREELPAYGTPHPDTTKWPNHKLVFISEPTRSENERNRNMVFRFVYAADRASQDLYNFEAGWSTVAGLSVPSVKRTYIIPREDYDPASPEIGSPMPDVPEGQFPVGYVLDDSKQVRSPQEIDSLYVVEERLYILHNPGLGKNTVTTYGGGVVDTKEELVPDGEAPDSGFSVIDSSVSPRGNGTSIKKTATMPDEDSYPVLYGQKYETALGIQLPFEEEVIPAGDLPAKNDVEPMDKWRSKRRGPDIDAIKAALSEIFITYPTQQSLQLPNVLKSVRVHVSRARSNGNSFSIGGSGSVSNDSSMAVSADLRWEIEEGFSGPVPAEVAVFFLPIDGATAGAIAAKVGANTWPVYRPKSHRVVITGHGESKRFSASTSSGGKSASESSGVSALSNVAVIPACLHGALDIAVEYHNHDSPTTLIDIETDAAVAEWGAYLGALRAQVEGGFYRGYEITDAQKAYLFARIALQEELQEFVTDLRFEDFEVQVHPNTLPATSPAAVSAGKYVVRSSVELYGYEMVRVTAVVVDLTGIV
jgi:hypothetical protein